MQVTSSVRAGETLSVPHVLEVTGDSFFGALPVTDVAKGLGIGFGGPTAVHLIGTFAINNFGGLGGGL